MAAIFLAFCGVAAFNVFVLIEHVRSRYKMQEYTFRFFAYMYVMSLILCLAGLILLIVFAVEGKQ